jgi:hypothetical protein
MAQSAGPIYPTKLTSRVVGKSEVIQSYPESVRGSGEEWYARLEGQLRSMRYFSCPKTSVSPRLQLTHFRRSKFTGLLAHNHMLWANDAAVYPKNLVALISNNLKRCDACPPPAILGHENTETVPSSGARIPRIRLARHPLCPDLCLGLLPTTSLIGL